jgi:hypothetical protein
MGIALLKKYRKIKKLSRINFRVSAAQIGWTNLLSIKITEKVW